MRESFFFMLLKRSLFMKRSFSEAVVFYMVLKRHFFEAVFFLHALRESYDYERRRNKKRPFHKLPLGEKRYLNSAVKCSLLFTRGVALEECVCVCVGAVLCRFQERSIYSMYYYL